MLFKQNPSAGYASLCNVKSDQLINSCKIQLNQSAYTEFSKDVVYPRCNDGIWNNLFILLEGEGTMFQGDVQTPITPGHLYFHPAGSQQVKRIYKKGVRKLHISFRLTIFEYIDVFRNLKNSISIEDVNHIATPMTQAILSRKAHENLRLIPLLFLGLEPLLEQLSHEIELLQAKDQKYEPVFKYINSHLSAQLRLEYIAQEVGMSVSQLTHSLPAETGFTVKSYLQQQLLHRVIIDLSTTDLLLKSIAEKYEFKTVEYFSSWFRKQVGVSPSRYRKGKYDHLKSGSLYD